MAADPEMLKNENGFFLLKKGCQRKKCHFFAPNEGGKNFNPSGLIFFSLKAGPP